MRNREVVVVAHRGLHHRAAENSLEALQLVVDANRRGLHLAVEFDIRTTRDGVPVINHDPKFRGVNLKDIEYRQLRQRFGDRTPCLLDDAVDVLRSASVTMVDPEVKELRNLDRVLQSLRPLRGQRVMVTSFDTDAVAAIRDNTDFEVGLLSSHRSHVLQSGALIAARQSEATALIPHYRQINAAFISAAHLQGLKIGTYTVNNSAQLRRHIEAAELDLVITDRPEILIPEAQARPELARTTVALGGWALALRSESPVAQ